MLLDTIHGLIERRILLNYRIDPELLKKVLPSGFRPKLYQGKGIGGICMIRFSGLRPRFVPELLGVCSENAAHRIAVEWDQDGESKEGVFIPRRDTSSRLNRALGGRVFPGIFQKSGFTSKESANHISLEIRRADGTREVSFAGCIAKELPKDSIFPSIEEASSFFMLGSTGYSATHHDSHFHGMELRTLNWKIEPMLIESAYSSFFRIPISFRPRALSWIVRW